MFNLQTQHWLVVSTPLKHISQLGWLLLINSQYMETEKRFQTTNQQQNHPTSKPSTGSRVSSFGCRPPFSDRSQLFRLDLARFSKDRGTVAHKMGEILTLNSLNHPFQVVTYNFWPISTRFVEFLDSIAGFIELGQLISIRRDKCILASPPPPPGFKWQHMRARGLCQPGC